MDDDPAAAAAPRAEVPHHLVRVLRRVPELADADDDTLLGLVGASANLVWAEGGEVFALGAAPEALFLVLNGAVDVIDEDGTVVRTAGPGEYVGERALLRGAAHSKGARAASRSELMVVPRASLEALLADHPELDAQVRARFERPRDRDDDRG